jgi:hypothetical protein
VLTIATLLSINVLNNELRYQVQYPLSHIPIALPSGHFTELAVLRKISLVVGTDHSQLPLRPFCVSGSPEPGSSHWNGADLVYTARSAKYQDRVRDGIVLQSLLLRCCGELLAVIH